MCYPVTCKKCGKTTWAGCGRHKDMVMARIPPEQRCTCSATTTTTPPPGGEPTTRADWYEIAKRCVKNNIYTNMITNGWNIDDEILKKAQDAGINTLAISIDGCKDTHDRIRKVGSYEKSMKAFKKMQKYNLVPAAITTVQKQNIDELEDVYKCLKEVGVQTWQIQIALPMGNFKEHESECVKPEDVQTIIDFAYSKIEDDMVIDLADCIGYYSKKEIQQKMREINELKSKFNLLEEDNKTNKLLMEKLLYRDEEPIKNANTNQNENEEGQENNENMPTKITKDESKKIQLLKNEIKHYEKSLSEIEKKLH